MKVFFYCVLFFLFLCCFFPTGDAIHRPAVALFDDSRQAIMSVTAWRDIDFGDRSAVGDGHRPARVFALQATVSVMGKTRSVSGVNETKDFYLIPYCSSTANGDAAAGGGVDVCSLTHYRGYVLLRFRGGWEESFSALLWQDSTLSPAVVRAMYRFQEAASDINMTLPMSSDTSQAAISSFSTVFRRMEFVENCNDLTDDCFQGRHMTYTTSFKEIPLTDFTGRMIFRVGLEGIWNKPWTLRLLSAMPHDASTDVDILLVLMDTNVFPGFSLWLTWDLLGNLGLVAFCMLGVFSFILGVKELGFRLSASSALNGTRVTVLYGEDESDEAQRSSLTRIMLATKEVSLKLILKLIFVPRVVWCYVNCWRRRRWGEGDAPEDGVNGPREWTGGSGVGHDVELHDIVVGPDSDSEDDELMCRICRSKRPVEELFAPCACDGSAKYVHTSCLEKWRAMTSNAEHRMMCAECKSAYTLVVERVPVSSDACCHSSIFLPACRRCAICTVDLIFFVFHVWAGGYYLKLCMYLVTGFDEGVVWSAANLYHWILGFYSIIALSLNLWTFEYVLRDFPELWQQWLLLFLSLGAVEIPLNYVGQVALSWLLNRPWSLEVSYGMGIVVTATLSVTLLPHLYVFLQSLSTEREVVAPRAEGTQNRVVL